jgi:hypothetical protein
VSDQEIFDEWAIVELMGHRKAAGHLHEVTIAGAGFLRRDIPPAGDDPGRTQQVAPASVYAIHPVAEAIARAMSRKWRPEPVQRWELPAGVLDAKPDDDELAEADFDDDDQGPFR